MDKNKLVELAADEFKNEFESVGLDIDQTNISFMDEEVTYYFKNSEAPYSKREFVPHSKTRKIMDAFEHRLFVGALE